jgi:hypothetical protein
LKGLTRQSNAGGWLYDWFSASAFILMSLPSLAAQPLAAKLRDGA